LAMPVVANVDALAHTDPSEWPSLLSAQLRSPVRWRQSVLTITRSLGAGDKLFCELGPGGPLSSMVRATVPAAKTLAIARPDDLDVLVSTLAGDAAATAEAHAGHEGERLYVFERLVVSPCAGIFELPTSGQAGGPGESDGVPRPIAIGDLVGFVSGTEVRSPFAGELMGVLAHTGERVQTGQPLAWLRSR
jgi:[acyl-carrier-protein] S-malonyltransferase